METEKNEKFRMLVGEEYEKDVVNLHTNEVCHLHRVVALRDFADVKEGDISGWVEDEYVIDWYDESWVYRNAMVVGWAMRLTKNSKVKHHAIVHGHGCHIIGSTIISNARVIGCNVEDAEIGGDATVTTICKHFSAADRPLVGDDDWHTEIGDNAFIEMDGGSRICGKFRDNTKIIGHVSLRFVTCWGDTVLDYSKPKFKGDYLAYDNCTFSNAVIRENGKAFKVIACEQYITFFRSKGWTYVIEGRISGSPRNVLEYVKEQEDLLALLNKNDAYRKRQAREKVKLSEMALQYFGCSR